MIPIGFLSTGSGVFTNWNLANIPANMVQNGIVYATLTAGNWFIFGSSTTGTTTTTYYYSTDGSTWSTGTLPSSAEAGSPLTNSSIMVVNRLIGSGVTASVNAFYTTTNGTTFTARTNPTSQTFWDGIHDGTYFLYPQSSAQNISYSTDGTTWTEAAMGWNINSALTYDQGTYYILQSSASGQLRKCTSNPTVAANWSLTTTLPAAGSGNDYIGPVYGNNIILVPTSSVGGSTSYVYSLNGGTSWNTGTLPAAITRISSVTPMQNPIRYFNGVFYFAVAVGGGSAAVYWSIDGISWSNDATSPTTGFSNGMAGNSDKMIMTNTRSYTSGSQSIWVGTP
jgi:hypothetical protein